MPKMNSENFMSVNHIKTDRFGWKYYEHLPEGFRVAAMEDFHTNGKNKVGMEYLIQRADQPHFEIHCIQEETQSIRLKPFLDHEMVFVKSK
jgi:hypothetical protein